MEKHLKKSPKFSTDYHCQAGGQNWLFCKTLVVGRLVRFCKCANVRLAKIVLKKCAVGKILKTFGLVCVSARSYRVSLLKNAFKSVRLNCQFAKSPFFSRHFQGCTVFLRLGITFVFMTPWAQERLLNDEGMTNATCSKCPPLQN